MSKETKVLRPTKKSEYELRFASREAQKGWRDLSATIRGPLADAWDFLTRSPLTETPTNYPLKGKLSVATRGGASYQRWQHKPTRKGDARIWFYVDRNVVYLERVHTSHPNETK